MKDSLLDRILSVLTYLTLGFGGLFVLILYGIQKRRISNFLQFNIMQSIFLSLLYYAFSIVLGFLVNILSFIPFVKYLVAQISFLLNVSILFNYSILQLIPLGFMIYCVSFSLLGKKPIIYWVSKVVDRNR